MANTRTSFPFRPRAPRRRQAGFTAIEISAVATIIAILSLILIVVVRNRVEESKVVAAKDDMTGIEKAEQIVFGYTGKFFRLQDLTRADEVLPTDIPATRALKMPRGTWNTPFYLSTETDYVGANWKGPFVNYHRTVAMGDLLAERPYLFRSPDLGGTLGGGPLMVLEKDRFDFKNPNGDALAPSTSGSSSLRQHPVDPWGNPYIFFGPGVIGTAGGQMAEADPNSYGSAAVYSLGPNGIVDSSPYARDDARSYSRIWLGNGDDLKREF